MRPCTIIKKIPLPTMRHVLPTNSLRQLQFPAAVRTRDFGRGKLPALRSHQRVLCDDGSSKLLMGSKILVVGSCRRPVPHAPRARGVNENAETRDRTGDLQIFSLSLSQLSYRGFGRHGKPWIVPSPHRPFTLIGNCRAMVC